MVGLEGLQQAEALLAGAAGAAGHLAEQLEGALGGARIAIGQAEIGIDDADQRHVGEIVALGDQLRADDDVGLALGDRFQLQPQPLARRPACRTTARWCARRENAPTTSSAMRSTPGPQATRWSSVPHSGQASGRVSLWPQWWQTSWPRKRCSTSQAEQSGHWKRWPQTRQSVSGA